MENISKNYDPYFSLTSSLYFRKNANKRTRLIYYSILQVNKMYDIIFSKLQNKTDLFYFGSVDLTQYFHSKIYDEFLSFLQRPKNNQSLFV